MNTAFSMYGKLFYNNYYFTNIRVISELLIPTMPRIMRAYIIWTLKFIIFSYEYLSNL